MISKLEERISIQSQRKLKEKNRNTSRKFLKKSIIFLIDSDYFLNDFQLLQGIKCSSFLGTKLLQQFTNFQCIPMETFLHFLISMQSFKPKSTRKSIVAMKKSKQFNVEESKNS
jgi:hypothetical protein